MNGFEQLICGRNQRADDTVANKHKSPKDNDRQCRRTKKG